MRGISRDGCGHLYPAIQWCDASVAQGLKAANGTIQEKVLHTHKTGLAALPRELGTACGKHPRHFPCFVF